MNALFEAAGEICTFMSERQWKFCIIGGLAVQQWGEPRTTLDADFTLLTGWGDEKRFVDEILEHFKPRYDGAREHALTRRVLLIRATNGVSVDIALGALPFEEAMIERARLVDFSPEYQLPCCSPDDLFIMKVFAGRPRDWQDAESVVDRVKDLDSEYILTHLKLLCELRDDLEPFERARILLRDAK